MVYRARGESPWDASWESPFWQCAEAAGIDKVHPASSPHRPATSVRLLHDCDSLYLHFLVEDRFVISTRTQFQQSVCCDSCVEYFVQPRGNSGYLNFEINCGGTLLSQYIEDPTRTADGFAKFTPLSAEYGSRVRIRHAMPQVVFPEPVGPVVWQVACQIPLDVLEAYVGKLGPLPHQVWALNFFKCADESSHPHWASWSPIGKQLNFHQPCYFAPLQFAATEGEEQTDTYKNPARNKS